MRIRVRAKQTGDIGTMPEENFDPNVFDRLDQSTPPSSSGKQEQPLPQNINEVFPAQQEVDQEQIKYQEAWRKAPAKVPKGLLKLTQDDIAKSWEDAKGYKLFQPKKQKASLSSSDFKDYKSSSDTINLIDQVLGLAPKLKKSPYVGGVQGEISNLLANSPFQSIIPTDERNYIGALLRLQGSGDRGLMGGRLIRDLVKMFGPAFPSALTSVDTTVDMLKKTRKQIVKDIDTTAKNLGMSYEDLPNYPNKEYQDLNSVNSYDDIYKKYGL